MFTLYQKLGIRTSQWFCMVSLGGRKNEQKEETKLKTESMVSPRKHSRFAARPGPELRSVH